MQFYSLKSLMLEPHWVWVNRKAERAERDFKSLSLNLSLSLSLFLLSPTKCEGACVCVWRERVNERVESKKRGREGHAYGLRLSTRSLLVDRRAFQEIIKDLYGPKISAFIKWAVLCWRASDWHVDQSRYFSLFISVRQLNHVGPMGP